MRPDSKLQEKQLRNSYVCIGSDKSLDGHDQASIAGAVPFKIRAVRLSLILIVHYSDVFCNILIGLEAEFEIPFCFIIPWIV
jgi:hypothetical protein